MAKLTLNSIVSGYQSQDLYNANNALIEAALENTLSRDGTTPNTMSAELDMNSQDINNVDLLTAVDIVTTSLVLNGATVTTTTTLTGGLAASEVTYDAGALSTKLDSDFIKTTGAQTKAGTLTLSDNLTANANIIVGTGGSLAAEIMVFDSSRVSADGLGSGRIAWTSHASSPYNQFLGRNIEENTGTGALEYGRAGDGVVLIAAKTDAADGDLLIGVGPDGIAAGTSFAGTANDEISMRFRAGLSPTCNFTVDGTADVFTINSLGVNLASTKGIRFGAATNRLDDYEEGTWTPTLGGTATYNAQTGTFTKIGDTVYFSCHIHVNAIGTGLTSAISGLPYTAAGTHDFSATVGKITTSATNTVAEFAYVDAASTQISIVSKTVAAAGPVSNDIFTASTQAWISGHYKV